MVEVRLDILNEHVQHLFAIESVQKYLLATKRFNTK